GNHSEVLGVDVSGNVNTTGRINPTLTTEQLRLSYDASNYASLTVGSTGILTYGYNGTNRLNFGNNALLPNTNNFYQIGDFGFNFSSIHSRTIESNLNLDFKTNGVIQARLQQASGNFSLGSTTDNGEKFQVTGTSSFSSTMKLSPNVDIQWGTNSFLRSDGVGTFRMGFGAGNTDAILAVNSLLSRVITGGFVSGTNANGNNLTLSSQVATGAGNSGNIIFQTSSPTTSGSTAQTLTTRVFIQGSTGNVGFGTESPQHPIDVTGTVRATQYNIGATSTNFIAGGGTGEINISNIGCDLRIGGAVPAIWTFVDNTRDIGKSDRRWRNGYFGTGITVGGTSTPTHAITLPTASTGIAIHNQADQTTNFEVGRLYWNSNVLTLSTEKNGTGSPRNISVSAANSVILNSSGGDISLNVGGSPRMNVFTSRLIGMINFPSTSGSPNISIVGISGTMGAPSGIQYQYVNLATIAQSGTAGYTGYYASIYEQSLGSGPKLLMDLGINSAANGGGTHTSRASIDNTGLGYLANSLLINKTTNSGERLQVEGS
ncbi:MAG: hypothetical protein ACK4ON_09760, partial [Bacteroidia bacterium]